MKSTKRSISKWQQYAFEEAFAIPTLFRNEVLPVNDRVKDWDWSMMYQTHGQMFLLQQIHVHNH